MNNLEKIVYDKPEVTSWLNGMVAPLMDIVRDSSQLALIGIRRGGVDVGQYLYESLARKGVHFELSLIHI